MNYTTGSSVWCLGWPLPITPEPETLQTETRKFPAEKMRPQGCSSQASASLPNSPAFIYVPLILDFSLLSSFLLLGPMFCFLPESSLSILARHPLSFEFLRICCTTFSSAPWSCHRWLLEIIYNISLHVLGIVCAQ